MKRLDTEEARHVRSRKDSILVISCCVANYHEDSDLNDTHYEQSWVGQKCGTGILQVLCLGSHKAEIKALAYRRGGTLI